MRYAYLGSDPRRYMDYADAATGRMLEVAPGGTYAVRAVVPGLPEPPGDGRWGPVPDAGDVAALAADVEADRAREQADEAALQAAEDGDPPSVLPSLPVSGEEAAPQDQAAGEAAPSETEE